MFLYWLLSTLTVWNVLDKSINKNKISYYSLGTFFARDLFVSKPIYNVSRTTYICSANIIVLNFVLYRIFRRHFRFKFFWKYYVVLKTGRVQWIKDILAICIRRKKKPDFSFFRRGIFCKTRFHAFVTFTKSMNYSCLPAINSKNERFAIFWSIYHWPMSLNNQNTKSNKIFIKII